MESLPSLLLPVSFATLLLFALVALVAIATPGPTVLLALANGSRFGVRRALPGMVGAVASDFVLVAAAALGLGAVLAASEFWFSVVKWVGAAYLAWLGFRLLRSEGALDLAGAGAQGAPQAGGSARRIFAKSFLVAVTNPKGYLFVSALMPQFVDPSSPQWPQYLVIGLVFAALDFGVMLTYAVIGARAVKLLRRRAVLWLDRCCGAALLALAASLAVYRRGSA
ncbi:Amino acid transporter [Burkholderiales bacterium 8X]|nr:Amino acid transporter [Burkholderiales bacterium 8X]